MKKTWESEPGRKTQRSSAGKRGVVGGEGEGGRPQPKFPKSGCDPGGPVGPDTLPNPGYICLIRVCLLVLMVCSVSFVSNF
ncbi:hypothetical protein FF1_012458 [Malus domestica]